MAQRARARQGQDQVGRSSLPRAERRRAARPAGGRTARRLPRVQRGLPVGPPSRAGAGRPRRRGDPARPPARRADARRTRGARAAGADARPARPRRARFDADGEPGADGGPGPLDVGPGVDRRGRRPLVESAMRRRSLGRYQLQAAIAWTHNVGRRLGGHRLAPDRRSVRRARSASTRARRRPQPGRRDRLRRRIRRRAGGPRRDRRRDGSRSATCIHAARAEMLARLDRPDEAAGEFTTGPRTR